MTLKESKELVSWICGWAAIAVAASWLIGEFTDIGRDDSDTTTSRSNLAVRTDALTGCQYLESKNGLLSPRLRGAGQQVGCRD
jgi:hypothetical protein